MEILQQKNIITDCTLKSKDKIVQAMGQMLYDAGYVDKRYIKGMLEKENSMDTYIGNGIALPHGIEHVKDAIHTSGMIIMTFPEGIDWNGHRVKMAIALAGKGDEHLDLLSNIAIKVSDIHTVDQVVSSEAEEIYRFFTE